MTDTPIERVARAIWEAESLPIIDDDLEAWQLNVARAAIAALEEPSEGMIEAATGSTSGSGLPDDDYDDDVKTHWRAMIRAAITE